MLATVQDFRNRMYEDITLPSGLVVRIRTLTSTDFIGLGELPIPPTPADETAPATGAQLALLKRYSHRALARGTVNPLDPSRPFITDELDDGGIPVLSIHTLHAQELLDCSPDDYAALGLAINTRSGLHREVRQDVDTFRADGISPVGSSPGGEISQAPVGDSGVNAGDVVPEPQDSLA